MKRLAIVAVLLLVFGGMVWSQAHPQGSIGQLSPIPLYPGNGVISPQFTNNFVFLDPHDWNLVISYPSNVDDSEFAAHPGPRVERRVALGKRVDPRILVSISKSEGGELRYLYSIQNGPKARQSIAFWSFDLPVTEATLKEFGKSAPFESSAAPASRLNSPASWSVKLIGDGQGRTSTTWSVQNSQQMIAPGTLASGFSLASEFKPGFIDATVSALPEPQSLSTLPVPKAVQKQLVRLESMRFDRNIALAIGPKFGPETNQITIVGNYFTGISLLTRQGQLKSDSPFVQEATSTLKNYLDDVARGAVVSASEYSGPVLVIRSKPQDAVEMQIDQAIRISLPIQ